MPWIDAQQDKAAAAEQLSLGAEAASVNERIPEGVSLAWRCGYAMYLGYQAFGLEKPRVPPFAHMGTDEMRCWLEGWDRHNLREA